MSTPTSTPATAAADRSTAMCHSTVFAIAWVVRQNAEIIVTTTRTAFNAQSAHHTRTTADGRGRMLGRGHRRRILTRIVQCQLGIDLSHDLAGAVHVPPGDHQPGHDPRPAPRGRPAVAHGRPPDAARSG
jgi:hypothetical protein